MAIPFGVAAGWHSAGPLFTCGQCTVAKIRANAPPESPTLGLSATPQSEQAFSDDGGKTWETNWINKYKRANDHSVESK